MRDFLSKKKRKGKVIYLEISQTTIPSFFSKSNDNPIQCDLQQQQD
jgi:hypothetical protein